MACQPFVKLDQPDKTNDNAVHSLLCVGNPCQLVQVVPLSGQFGYGGKYRGRNMPWRLPRKYLFPAVGGEIRPGDDRFVLQPSFHVGRNMEFDLCRTFFGCGFGRSPAFVPVIYFVIRHSLHLLPFHLWRFVSRPGDREGTGRRHPRCRESRIPCDRREREMVRCATTGSTPNGTAPQGKVAGVSEKTPRGGFEGLRIQPCSLRLQKMPRPDHQIRTRHSGSHSESPAYGIGRGEGR